MNPKESNKAELPNFALAGVGHNYYGPSDLKHCFSLIDPFHWGGDVSLFWCFLQLLSLQIIECFSFWLLPTTKIVPSRSGRIKQQKTAQCLMVSSTFDMANHQVFFILTVTKKQIIPPRSRRIKQEKIVQCLMFSSTFDMANHRAFFILTITNKSIPSRTRSEIIKQEKIVQCVV